MKVIVKHTFIDVVQDFADQVCHQSFARPHGVSLRLRAPSMGARLRGHTTTLASKKGSQKGGSQILKEALQKVLRRVLRKCLVVGC